MVLPVGEEADAVGAGLDGVKVVFHGGEGEIFVDVLAHLVGGLDVEGDFCDYAQRAEADDGSLEKVVVLLPREFHDVASGGDEFERGDRGGEVAIFSAGTMRGGAAGSCYGDVRERGEVVESETFGVEQRGQLAVGDAGVHCDGARLGIERDDFVQWLQGQKSVFGIDNVVEAVARAQDFEFGLFLDEILNLGERLGGVQAVRAVFEVAGPVCQLRPKPRGVRPRGWPSWRRRA